MPSTIEASGFEAEVTLACEAVKLASKLCQVRIQDCVRRPIRDSFATRLSALLMHFTPILCCFCAFLESRRCRKGSLSRRSRTRTTTRP